MQKPKNILSVNNKKKKYKIQGRPQILDNKPCNLGGLLGLKYLKIIALYCLGGR